MSPSIETVLRALAELAPAVPDRVLDVTRGGQPLVWLENPQRCGRDRVVERLAAADLLHRDERILRRAWGLVAGALDVEGVTRRVRLPLLSEPVRLERTVRGYRIVSAGDLELTPLIEDRALAARLESAPGLGSASWLSATGSEAWLRTAAAAAGLPVPEGDLLRDNRPARLPTEGLVLFAAAALFAVRDTLSLALGDRLRAWAGQPGLACTALASVYDGSTSPTGAAARPARHGPAGRAGPDEEPVRSPLPLTGAQREVVRRARREAVTVVSGPPGNGKSHAVIAAAIDVVDRGGSVLVVTQSGYAAEVLGELLHRHPGPVPILFGDAQRRSAVAETLTGGVGVEVSPATLAADRAAVAAATDRVRRLTGALTDALELERSAESATYWEPLLGSLRLDVPGAFNPGTDLAAARRGVDRARIPAVGRWQRWRRGLIGRRVRRRLGAADSVPFERLREAVDAARAVAARARLASTGGTELTPLWAALETAEQELSLALGTAMRHRAGSAQRWDANARRSTGALAVALRAGRNRRRELLAALDGAALVRALPLWIGTVTDVEELLPSEPGLFDLVIMDEASHIDQIRAAPVLARARRALIVGDPQQLRFVSFVADVDVAATLDRYGLDPRVDVRRVSVFDLAAGAAPVTWLDEHFRSVPQLIGFSAQRFYGDRIAVATRHPGNESVRAIEVVPVPTGADEGGVNRAEVAAAVSAVRRLAGQGWASIGVVTPFRAQADALESALVEAFSVTEIERFGLRVGTVHSFQGSEADAVVISLAVAEPVNAGRLRFLADPALFNVMVTRARRRIVVLNSLSAPDGLLGEYLAYASTPSGAADRSPRRWADASAVDLAAAAAWPAELAARLVEVGVPVRQRFPVGRWSVDLCLGTGADAVGLICAVHPEGVAAHLDRQRALSRAGWRLIEAFASASNGDPVRAALDLAARLREPSGG